MPDERDESTAGDGRDEPAEDGASSPATGTDGDTTVPVDESSDDADANDGASDDADAQNAAGDDANADAFGDDAAGEETEAEAPASGPPADDPGEGRPPAVEPVEGRDELAESPADDTTDRAPGEGGLSYEGSPDRDQPRREKPEKPRPGGAEPESGTAGATDAAGDETDSDEAEPAAEPAPAESSDGEEAGIDESASTGSSAPVPTAAKNRPAAETETPADNVGGISTPPDDEELPLADHIEEMVSRLAIVLLFGAAGTAIGLLWATQAIDIIWDEALPQAEAWRPHLYHPLELWLTRIKVASLLGVMIALPVFVYQTYRFMRPGLYSHERKYYLAAVPTSVVLAGIGMIFSYLLVLPVLFRYFTYYSEGSAAVQYSLGSTFNLIITLTAFLAIVFQIPLFIMLAVMMGVTTRRWLADKRLYFWAGFAGLAFAFTIDPTAMAAGLVAITMIVLFEGTLALLKWTGVE